MNILDFIDSMPLTQALGWVLVHFIWQGTIIAAALAVILSLMRRYSAGARYVLCCTGMLLMMIVPIVTLVLVLRATARPIAELAAGLSLADLDSLPIWDQLAQYLPALTLCWLLGVLIFQGRLLAHWLGARRLRRCGTSPAPQRWERTVDDLCGQFGIRHRVEIMVSSLAAVPMVLGWLKPVILVPAGVLSGLTTNQLTTIIAHELAHVRRHDYIINLIQAVFESLLFYHPAVWWLSNRLRVEREYCCDDVAVKACGDALCYARALSSLETMRSSGTEPALASTGGPLMNRIFRIVGVTSKPSRRIGGWIAPIVIALSLTVATSAMIISSAGDKDKKPPAKKVVKKHAIDQVDIVALAKKAGAKRAKTLAALREAGLDNATLLTVLAELESDPAVVKKVEHAAQEAIVKKQKFAEYEQQLIEKMKAEGASKEEIKKAIAQFRKQAEMKQKGEYEQQLNKAEHEQQLKMAEYEQQLIKKMKAEGASKEEIKKAIEQFRKQAQKKVKGNPKSELAAKEEYLVQKMKAEGASDKEIKHAVMKLRDKAAYMQLSDENKAFVDKMMEAGYSRDEIAKALQERQMKVKVKKDSEFEAKEKHLIQKMEADGASHKEIQQAVLKLREKAGMPPPQTHDVMAKEAQLIKKLEADGASEKEIKKAITDFRKKTGYNPSPPKKIDELKMKEKKLIEKMSADGASKEEIKKAIAKLHASAGPPAKKVKIKASEEDMKLIKKMEAAGMSKEEIMRVLKALHSEDKT